MTTDTYRNFIAIVECGNILAASQKLMVAQPALSNQLKNLEKNMGTRLLNRGSRAVTLTAAGEIFYQKAKIIVSMEDSAKKEINDYISGLTGTLSISLPPSNPDSLMRELFDKFVEDHPKVNYNIYEVLSEDVADNVRMGLSEIGLIRSKVKNMDDFDIYPYETEYLMAVVSRNHPLAGRTVISIEDLEGYSLAVPTGCVENIQNAFKDIKKEADIRCITSIRHTAIEWASNYNYVAIVPFGKKDYQQRMDMKVLSIEKDRFNTKRSFITLKGRELSQLAKEFFDYQGI